MFKAFFNSLMDPYYGVKVAGEPEGGEDFEAADADPFAKREKAGLASKAHTVTVDELETMGGGGSSKVAGCVFVGGGVGYTL